MFVTMILVGPSYAEAVPNECDWYAKMTIKYIDLQLHFLKKENKIIYDRLKRMELLEKSFSSLLKDKLITSDEMKAVNTELDLAVLMFQQSEDKIGFLESVRKRFEDGKKIKLNEFDKIVILTNSEMKKRVQRSLQTQELMKKRMERAQEEFKTEEKLFKTRAISPFKFENALQKHENSVIALNASILTTEQWKIFIQAFEERENSESSCELELAV
ncbi:MAG: hypothetical protein H7836_15295 [Magnetococcus sp. YQC-3]